MVQGRAREILGKLVHWSIVVMFSVLLAFPFYWMLITTFKRTSDLYDLRHNPFYSTNGRPSNISTGCFTKRSTASGSLTPLSSASWWF